MSDDHYSDYTVSQTHLFDYGSFTLTGSSPVLGGVISISGTPTIDQYGNVYFGLGVSVGPDAPAGISGSLAGGIVLNGPPGEGRLEQFLTGPYLNVSGGAVFGGGLNISLSGNDIALEGGLYVPPQASATIGWSWLVADAHH